MLTHLIRWPPTSWAPSQTKVSWGPITPSSRAAATVKGLAGEPGSKLSLTQKFLHIWFQASDFCSSVMASICSWVYIAPRFLGSLRSYRRLEAMARISPLLGFITSTAAVLLPMPFIHSSMYFSTIFWILVSMVETMVFPFSADLMTFSILDSASR